MCPPQGRRPSRQHARTTSGAAPPRTCDQRARRRAAPSAARKARSGVGMRDGGRQPDAPRRRRELRQPRQAERQLVAALGAGQRVDLVHHDRARGRRRSPARRAGEQQRQALRRGQQDLRRVLALAGAAVGGRVAGAGLDADGQAHLLDRRGQVARDVDRQRLQRRDVEGVQPLGRGARGAGRPGSAGSRPASCRRRSARSAAR